VQRDAAVRRVTEGREVGRWCICAESVAEFAGWLTAYLSRERLAEDVTGDPQAATGRDPTCHHILRS
jgi:hypothetical protein